MTGRRVAVIGGGPAGLAAALALQTMGAEVTLFEAATAVGGMLSTERDGDWVIERGAPASVEPDPEVRALLDAAGVTARTVRAGARGQVRCIIVDGAPVPLPKTAAELGRSRLLTLGGLRRLITERRVPLEQRAEESVDQFARRRYGDEIADRFFDPLVAGTWGADSREILARYAFPAMTGYEQRGTSALHGTAHDRIQARRRGRTAPAGSWTGTDGMNAIAVQMAQGVADLRLHAPVARVTVRGGDVIVVANAIETRHEAALFAVPAHAFRHLVVEGDTTGGADAIAAIPYTPVASIAFGVRDDQVARPTDGARLLIPSREKRCALGVAFPSLAYPARTPPGHLLINVLLGRLRIPGFDGVTPEALIEIAWREVVEVLGVAGDPVRTACALWPDALPQAVPGHAQRLARADAIEASCAPLAFCGAWRDGGSVAAAMNGGVRAAQRVAARLGWIPSAGAH